MKKIASLHKDCFSIFSRTTSDIVICLDKNFLVTLLNPVAENFYHRKIKKTIGLSYFSFASEQKSVFSKKELEKLSFERNTLKRKKAFNNHANLLWSVDCLFDSHNRSKGFLIIGKIQQLKPKKNKPIFKVPKENISLEELIFNWPDNIFWTNRESIYLGCNKQQADNFGVKPEEVVGQTIYALAENLNWDRRLADEIYINDQEVMRTGKSIIIEEQAIWMDGKERVALSRKLPIINEKGKCIGLLGIATDITELKERENRIKIAKEISERKSTETELYLEHLIANLPDNIYWADRKGTYKGCNQQQLENLGLKKTDFVGKTIYDVAEMLRWDKKLAEEIFINDQQVMETGKSIAKEETVIWKDGKQRIYLSRKLPAADANGNCVGILGISTEITKQKEVEYALREANEKSEALNKAKAEFIANMSHDVKTPLSGIISISEALSSRVQPEYQELTHDILQASQNLMAFFVNCIELSKLEGGSISVTEEVFSLKKLLSELAGLFRPTVKTKGLELYVDYDEVIPTNLLGSRVILYRVLLNLIGNAVKFTNQGSITLKAQLSRNSTEEKAVIKLTVADTGIGIATDKQKVIFERFARLTSSYQGGYEGSGIGLYIVDEFVKSMKGEIHVKSEEGKGSVFMVVLPFQIPVLVENEYQDSLELPTSVHDSKPSSLKALEKKSLVVPSSAQKAKSIRAEKGGLKPQILLVEDTLIAQKGVIMVLSSLGCEVDVAESGKEALKLFKPGHYALVLMDLGLPDMKGCEVAECLKKVEETTAFSVPIIGLSAHVTQEEMNVGRDKGMVDVLSKPLLMDQAQSLLKQYVPHLYSREDSLVPSNNESD